MNLCEFLSLDDVILFSRLLLVFLFLHNCVFLLLYLVSIFTNSFFVVQPLPFCSRVCDNSDRLYNFVLRSIALVLEGEILVWYLWSTNPSLPIVKLLFDVYWLQKSGDFMTIAGFNAENEILHTLAFLAGLMIWSQVCFWHSNAEVLFFGIFFSFLLLFGFWKMMVMLFVASDNCAFELSI